MTHTSPEKGEAVEILRHTTGSSSSSNDNNNNDNRKNNKKPKKYFTGGYNGSNGFCYGVDSGCIGIAHKALLTKTDDVRLSLGTLHNFSSNVSFECDDAGIFTITSDNFVLKIDTSLNSDSSE